MKITRRQNGAIITETIPRTFQLCCQCYVHEYSQCGGVCYYCRLELEEKNLLVDPAYQLHPIQLDWLSTPCIRHYRTCQYAFCGKGCCCSRHSTQIQLAERDTKIFCLEHYLLIQSEFEISEKKAKLGIIMYKMSTFFRSLFFKHEQ